MPTVEKLSIALPAEMAAVVREAVEGGEYSSNSEEIRDAVRDWTHKRKLREISLTDLRRKWQEAVSDDSAGLNPEPVFEGLERKYKRLTPKKGQ